MTTLFDKTLFFFILPIMLYSIACDVIDLTSTSKKELIAHELEMKQERERASEELKRFLFEVEERERLFIEQAQKEERANFLIEKALYDRQKKVQKNNKDIKEALCKAEGYTLEKYNDLGNVSTIGCGITGFNRESITEEEHDMLLDNLVNTHIKEIKSVGVDYDKYNRNQQIAMILSIHQLGLPLFKRQAFTSCLNGKKKCTKQEIKHLWGENGFAKHALFQQVGNQKIKVASVEAKGLRNRRRFEASLFVE